MPILEAADLTAESAWLNVFYISKKLVFRNKRGLSSAQIEKQNAQDGFPMC